LVSPITFRFPTLMRHDTGDGGGGGGGGGGRGIPQSGFTIPNSRFFGGYWDGFTNKPSDLLPSAVTLSIIGSFGWDNLPG
jgi:hypothetical protein